jgi:hypothetical protein
MTASGRRPDVTVGLGVGIPMASGGGAGCDLNRSVVTAASDSRN